MTLEGLLEGRQPPRIQSLEPRARAILQAVGNLGLLFALESDLRWRWFCGTEPLTCAICTNPTERPDCTESGTLPLRMAWGGEKPVSGVSSVVGVAVV